MRFRLRYQGEAVGSSGSQLPALQAAQGQGVQETDERGRAFLGDMSIAEGSGELAAGLAHCSGYGVRGDMLPQQASFFHVAQLWRASWLHWLQCL